MDVIDVEVQFKSGFSILSGYGLAGVLDDTVIKDSQRCPYIPGSSIKGVLRRACEEIALVARQNIFLRVVDEMKCLQDKGKSLQEFENYSPVTRIFGNPFIPAAFEFSSSFLQPVYSGQAEFFSEASTWAESHNEINDATRTAREDALFCHEVAMRTETNTLFGGYVFRFQIEPVLDPVDDKLTSLLFCGICFADRIGAKKSRGKGVVRFVPHMPYEGKSLDEWLQITLNGGK